MKLGNFRVDVNFLLIVFIIGMLSVFPMHGKLYASGAFDDSPSGDESHPKYLEISKDRLYKAGFTRIQQGNTFFGTDSDHIHIGAFTQAGGRVAKDGNAFITFISLKRNNNPRGYRLRHDPFSGYFGWNNIPNKVWLSDWKNKLRSLGIIRWEQVYEPKPNANNTAR